MIRLFFLCLICASFYSGASSFKCDLYSKASLASKSDFKNLLANSVFQILLVTNDNPRTEKRIGTATLISEDGYMLTAKHIFELNNYHSQSRIIARLAKNESEFVTYNVELVKPFHKTLDIAMLRLTDVSENTVVPIPVNFKSKFGRHEARIMGYPIDSQLPSLSELGNMYSQTNDGYAKVTQLSAFKGYSGGLLVNTYGYGMGVLSGKMVVRDDGSVTWLDIDFEDNGALNVVPLWSVLDFFADIKSNKIDSYYHRIISSDEYVQKYELEDFIRRDRFSASLLAFKLAMEREKFTIGEGNFLDTVDFINCLLPYNLASQTINRWVAKNSSIANKTFRHTLSNARLAFTKIQNSEAQFIESALAYYKQSNEISKNLNISTATANYMSLEYSIVAHMAKNEGMNLTSAELPQTILSEQLKQNNYNLAINTDNRTVAASYSLLLDAASTYLNEQSTAKAGSILAEAAFITSGQRNPQMKENAKYLAAISSPNKNTWLVELSINQGEQKKTEGLPSETLIRQSIETLEQSTKSLNGMGESM
ncbi:S1 family peptidase [Pseudoalteromonas sp. T1lg65]|uniref:S1 family peptidase n=1 Tax=Pseudoalteromonas sp. T1lg65 TaxID=2077101 RepID=UPI003F792FA8